MPQEKDKTDKHLSTFPLAIFHFQQSKCKNTANYCLSTN